MSKITWNESGSRYFETGIDRGVLFVGDNPGVAWNGLISITGAAEGSDTQPFYYDGVRYINLAYPSEFSGSIEAYSRPPEFDLCEGVKEVHSGFFTDCQPLTPFALSYRTLIGNDEQNENLGYKLHLVYNMMVEPSSVTHETMTEQGNPIQKSWAFTTSPTAIPGRRPSSHITISSLRTPSIANAVSNILYGSDTNPPRLPLPTEIVGITMAIYDQSLYDATNTVFG